MERGCLHEDGQDSQSCKVRNSLRDFVPDLPLMETARTSASASVHAKAEKFVIDLT
jgi:hypothetical protein